MLDMLDYSYNWEKSIIHRINPIIKIVGLLFYVLVCMFKFNNTLFIINISFVFLLMLLSNVSLFRYLKKIWNLKYILIILYFLLFRFGMRMGTVNTLILEVIFFIFFLNVIVFTTSKEDIGKGLAYILNIFNLIGISIKKIAAFITNIISFFRYFLGSYNNELIRSDINGVTYSSGSFIDRKLIFIKNIKSIYNNSVIKVKNRKENMKNKFLNFHTKIKYNYWNKMVVYDFIFLLCDFGMLLFYVFKVR